MPGPGTGGSDRFAARTRGDSQESEWTLGFLQGREEEAQTPDSDDGCRGYDTP